MMSTPCFFLGSAPMSIGEWIPHKIQGMGAPVLGVMEGRSIFEVPGYDEWTNMPNVWHNGDKAKLNGNHCENTYRKNAMPVLWESLSQARLLLGRVCFTQRF